MSLTHRVFSDAFRDMQRAIAMFDQPLYNTARRSMLGSPASLFNSNTAGGLFRYPATDMVETPESYELSAELPGYDKKNIKIELADSRTLVLSGSVNEQREIKPPAATDATPAESKDSTTASASEGEASQGQTQETQSLTKEEPKDQQLAKQDQTSNAQWWVKERVSGSFSRSFAFPTPIKADNIKASFDNGILKVVVPKTVEDQSKQINIE